MYELFTIRTYNSIKVIRPTMKILIGQINELGYVKTGKIYGVSDNAIRKWLKGTNVESIKIVS